MINMDGLVSRLSASVLEELVDDAVMGVIFDVHRASKLGFLAVEDGCKGSNGETEQSHSIVIGPNLDVFGQAALKNKQHECICPSCNRTLAASRFAPHLEKCMGMGRNSSRIASRRIANSSKEGNGTGSNGGGSSSAFPTGILSDDEDDADWTFGGTEKKRKRKDKHNNRKKNSKVKNGASASVTAAAATVADHNFASMEGAVVPVEQSTTLSNGPLSYETLGVMDKKSLLLQMCGVVSEHTGKLCTRSLRCPQHSDEQKRNIRLALLGSQYEQNQLLGTYIKSEPVDSDNVGNVDVDSYEDGDSQAVRDALTRGTSWDHATEHSGTSSPADSTSTTSSSSKKPITPKGGKKGKKGSKNSTPPSSIAGNAALEDLYSH
ncbi:ataxin-7-like protein 3 isoform X2 [Neocloeon triangulifer]|uniref:ataxin-7-like protein 3 isoform X2 n=1 Tax=Neocloeon triangulifer TaxID=2078957 RepID=UPI00286F652D|nr:ataxin-7-like protein 3 isoform X2 [Neocloeon triangulifer]